MEFVRQGHSISVMLPDPDLLVSYSIDYWEGVQIIRLRTAALRDVGYFRRTFSELLMPFFMLRHWRKSPLLHEQWDGIIWYSPSIFFGPLVKALKAYFDCKAYLIIRDIFPDWALDLGLIGRGLPYQFFKVIANFQYSLANTIGVQTPGNRRFFVDWAKNDNRNLEVLQNWLASEVNKGCSISIEETALAGRKIFVYAGNMGVAQDMGILMDLAYEFRFQMDVGFVFVGRGTDLVRLKTQSEHRELTNILFFDEIEPDEIPGLYAQCDIGLLSLDKKHKTHNIPGKFLSYMRAGLPVLASVNKDNDIIRLIHDNKVGRSCSSPSVFNLKEGAEWLLGDLDANNEFGTRCIDLYQNLFTPAVAVKTIVDALD
jgi:glycosyltransferase involved in cell wall biosynthesis